MNIGRLTLLRNIFLHSCTTGNLYMSGMDCNMERFRQGGNKSRSLFDLFLDKHRYEEMAHYLNILCHIS